MRVGLCVQNTFSLQWGSLIQIENAFDLKSHSFDFRPNQFLRFLFSLFSWFSWASNFSTYTHTNLTSFLFVLFMLTATGKRMNHNGKLSAPKKICLWFKCGIWKNMEFEWRFVIVWWKSMSIHACELEAFDRVIVSVAFDTEMKCAGKFNKWKSNGIIGNSSRLVHDIAFQVQTILHVFYFQSSNLFVVHSKMETIRFASLVDARSKTRVKYVLVSWLSVFLKKKKRNGYGEASASVH